MPTEHLILIIAAASFAVSIGLALFLGPAINQSTRDPRRPQWRTSGLERRKRDGER